MTKVDLFLDYISLFTNRLIVFLLSNFTPINIVKNLDYLISVFIQVLMKRVQPNYRLKLFIESSLLFYKPLVIKFPSMINNNHEKILHLKRNSLIVKDSIKKLVYKYKNKKLIPFDMDELGFYSLDSVSSCYHKHILMPKYCKKDYFYTLIISDYHEKTDLDLASINKILELENCKIEYSFKQMLSKKKYNRQIRIEFSRIASYHLKTKKIIKFLNKLKYYELIKYLKSYFYRISTKDGLLFNYDKLKFSYNHNDLTSANLIKPISLNNIFIIDWESYELSPKLTDIATLFTSVLNNEDLTRRIIIELRNESLIERDYFVLQFLFNLYRFSYDQNTPSEDFLLKIINQISF